jgi:ABC-type Zn uptake system ZnuABC Zn-binding protein ZnuA
MAAKVAAVALATTPLPAKAELPKVVAGDGVLCDLVRTLSGGATDVRCLIPPGIDPHYLRLTPANRRDISRADLVLINGYDLTPSLEALDIGKKVMSVGERAVPSNTSGDPHLWHNPLNTKAMAAVVVEAFRALPLSIESVQALQRRAKKAYSILLDLDRWNKQQINTISRQGRVVVSEHRAFSHFAERYGLREVAMIDDYATGGQLRPSSLRAISDAVKASNTKVVFAERFPPSKTLLRISKSSGKPIAPSPLVADGTMSGKNLIATATANTCTIVDAQGGTCDHDGAKALEDRWLAVR